MRISAGRQSPDIEPALARLIEGRHHDPFEVLGGQRHGEGWLVRALLPGASEAWIVNGEAQLAMKPVGDSGLFQYAGEKPAEPHYRIGWRDRHGQLRQRTDPYTFVPQLSDFDLYLFGEGRHWHIWHVLGAHTRTVDDVDGTLFAVWAPNAERVSVIGDFNDWDGHAHPMRIRYGSGVWELFVPGLGDGALYKFSVRNRNTGEVVQKADPYGNHFELRPKTASIVCTASDFEWKDADWLTARRERDWLKSPMSVYEVHLGSWRRDGDGNFLNYRELAHRLVDYVLTTGFTHIELLPVAEHPFDASWGYQTTGYYAPTSRHGNPDDFRYFVDHCHRHDIGVLLDWAPAHFPRDSHALARFDGTALYEHADPRRGEHRDWGTLIYNYGRLEVKNFLLANANYWLEEFHIDGLRVDAVASMLYLDYSRNAGDWTPNIYGGNENLEAIDFIREVNELTHGEHPGTLIIAEESTAWPQVTRPVFAGGLGFSMKWNMGWMHDTLEYFSKDPLYRKYHHNELTFGLLYAFSENFVLPFSHDEVVHGKGSMIAKMPGDDWQRFANLRLLYTYMYTYPGTRLLFMGSEFGQRREWGHQRELDWDLLEYTPHSGLQRLVGDLNRLYRSEAALHRAGFESAGFEWLDCNDASHSLLSYLRLGGGECIAVVLNFTPMVHRQFRLGVPIAGRWQELFNSDSEYYGGSNTGNPPTAETVAEPWMGRPHQLQLTVPPLGAIVLKHVSG